ncbi:MAG TPA: hypothetical protein DGG94_17275 [Micromonosporaceae bacterium]|nr:hypothetical protein [Micromonosporaceae bacterium]HCU51524.1 hypothetical protein [Micromonosporaceae bacterium]
MTSTTAGRYLTQPVRDPRDPPDIQIIVPNAATNETMQGFRPLSGFTGQITLPDPNARYTITVDSPS